jgi:alkylhydroperoxidase/carboxymuconolactone decarboxylase family protein YurZ
VTTDTQALAELLSPGLPDVLVDLDAELPVAVLAVAEGDDAGARLSSLDRELVALAAAASPAVLRQDAMEHHQRRALELGASAEQVTEVLVLASVLGLHALTAGLPQLGALLSERGHPVMSRPLDARQLALRARFVGEDPYWQRFERHLPGFLDGLLRLAPDAFELFFAYSGLPWQSGSLAPRLKELLYVAIDSTPTHVYVPGLWIHVANARGLGASPGDVATVMLAAARAGAAGPEALA